MRSRGPKRRHNPNIPDHIDQSKLPTGVYFDHRYGGSWYTLHYDEHGKQRRRNIGTAHLKLSEIHRIIEESQGINRDSLKWLCDKFHASTQYKELSAGSKKDYKYCREVVLAQPTKLGKPLGQLPVSKFSAPLIQRLIDRIAADHPSKAAHVLRYLRRLFRWGAVRGYCSLEPVSGLESPKERKQHRLPSDEIYERLLALAKERGPLPRNRKGACPAYLWIAMEIGYLCRLRGIEVDTLTEGNATKAGLLCNRRKGSRDNITAWSPRLQTAWDAAITLRNTIWTQRRSPIPMKADDRPIFVTVDGTPLSKDALDSAWQRFMVMAVGEGIIEQADRFGMHDLKRKGITDTPGTRAEKQEASGHRSEAMMDVYDLSVPIVSATKTN